MVIEFRLPTKDFTVGRRVDRATDVKRDESDLMIRLFLPLVERQIRRASQSQRSSLADVSLVICLFVFALDYASNATKVSA